MTAPPSGYGVESCALIARMLEADVTKSGNLDRNRLDDRHHGMVGIYDRLLVFDDR